MGIIDAYVKEESAMVTEIATQGEYIYLEYYYFDEHGNKIVCEEHCLPDHHKCKEKSITIVNTPRKTLSE